MTKRALFYPLFAVMIAAVGSCSYGWRYFQLSVPPGGMVEIYEHSSLDDHRHIPFRLVALEAIAGEHRATGQGEAAKRLFRKQAYWYALKITES